MDDPAGRRLVGLQATLFALIGSGPWWLGPPAVHGVSAATWSGAVLMALGAWVALAGGAGLGRNLTPFPRPRTGGMLVTSGLYAYARHPIYVGVWLLAAGWATTHLSVVTAVGTLLLALLFDRKSRYEERTLAEAYPGYADYAAKTRRFVPFVY